MKHFRVAFSILLLFCGIALFLQSPEHWWPWPQANRGAIMGLIVGWIVLKRLPKITFSPISAGLFSTIGAFIAVVAFPKPLSLSPSFLEWFYVGGIALFNAFLFTAPVFLLKGINREQAGRS